jgi:Dyp-type peroxidase family
MRAFAEPKLDLSDLQGNVLRGYGYPMAASLWFSIGDAAAGRAWLGGLVERVTTGAPWSTGKPEATCNVAITAAGLRALGLDDAVLAAYPPDFLQGMAARAESVGDRDEDHPSGWEAGFGTGQAHVLVILNALEERALDAAVALLDHDVSDPGVTLIAQQRAAVLAGAREHFGFSDGFAQPAIEGDGNVALPGQGTPEAGGRWSELALGEFILGYHDQDEQLPPAPRGPLGLNATFMVYRKLHQDVAAFRRALRERAAAFGGSEEQLAAKIAGRWRDGTPTALSPDRPDPGRVARPEEANDFRYEDDAEGLRCPLGAHVRRANPRDALGWHGTRTRRHRMIRRGMPYGPPLPDGTLEDDGAERGLIFVSLCASLRRQFEIVQAQWLGDGNLFGLGDDRDWLLLADDRPNAKMTVQGRPPRFLAGQPRFVTVRGGEYLLVPSLSGLRALASGTAA